MTRTATEKQAPGKSPSTRLLDLLAGWAAFVGADEENQVRDAGLSSEHIGELYQVAGAQSITWDELSPEERDAAVRSFVTERVLPLLLAGEPQSQSRSEAA